MASKNKPGCNCCDQTVPCSVCSTGFGPQTFKVVISGMANGNCGTCSELDGTFFLENSGAGGGCTCNWQLTFDTSVCGTYVSMSICLFESAGTYFFDFYINTAGGGTQMVFRQTYPSAITCTTLANEALPFFANDTTGECDGTGSTVQVTAV